jgi:hypothetical protein
MGRLNKDSAAIDAVRTAHRILRLSSGTTICLG